MSNLTIEQFHRVLPKQVKTSVNQQLIDQINSTLTDPIIRENYRDNLLSYTSVMQDGKFKIQSYLDAVRYVSFKLLGSSNIEAYTKTFPDRYQNFMVNGTSAKDIASYVTSYNKNKLVNLIFEQTLIPFHVLNADKYQKALNVQVELMVNANSEKVRSDAANSVLTHLKPPETKKIELDISVKEDKSLSDLKSATMELVAAQRLALQAGSTTIEGVAHSKIISDVDIIDV
tara:strand:+ start:1565 stop:2254 length:690 start_codon:yes stop_codon:yes gene_type:complete